MPIRVLDERVSLIELYDGPVAEMEIIKSEATRTCRSLAEELCNTARTGAAHLEARQSKYVRNISSVKIRGSIAATRPLSTMLRPLAESIEERLLSISSMGRNENGVTIDAVDRTTARRGDLINADADLDSDGPTGGKISTVSSDSDMESLAYTASVFSLQVLALDMPHFVLFQVCMLAFSKQFSCFP